MAPYYRSHRDIIIIIMTYYLCTQCESGVCHVQVNAIKLSPGVVFSEDGRVKEGPQPVSSNTGPVLALTHRDHY